MTHLEVLSELVRVGAAGGNPGQLALALERMSPSVYLGIFTSQEPAGFRLFLTASGQSHLGEAGVTGLSRGLSDVFEEGLPPPEGREVDSSGPNTESAASDRRFERVEVTVPEAPDGARQVVCYPVLEGHSVVGGVLAPLGSGEESRDIRQVIDFVQLVLSRDSLEARTRAYEKTLDFLNEIYRHNLEEQEAGAALGAEFTLSRLADVFRFDAAALALPDGEHWKLLYWMATDTPQEFVDSVSAQTLEVLSRDQGATSESVMASYLWQHRPPPEGLEPRSYFMLPLLFDPDGKRPGVLGLYSASEELLTPDEMQLLVLLTPGLSIAFRNSQLLFALERQAKIDEMSGLYNYRTFRGLLGRELKRVARHHTPLSLLLFDIDHFKSVNDTYGHQRGDDVLRGLARVLLESKRGVDVVARYGGEEFVMILPETDREGAARLAEKVRARIADARLMEERPVTASIGVSCYSGHESGTEDDLIHQADKALYRAKRTGRNKIQCAWDVEPDEGE